MLDLYKYLISNDGRKVIKSGWKSIGIKDAMNKSVSGLEPTDPFSSIDPIVRSDQEHLPPQLPDDTDIPQIFAARQIIDSDNIQMNIHYIKLTL